MKSVFLVFIIAAVTLAVGCSSQPSESAKAPVAAEPEVQADGATLMVAESAGIKSEVKTFPAGALIQVSRASWPDGRRSVTVKMRNGYTVDLQDRNDIDRAIEMSSEELLAAVKKIPGAAEYATVPAPVEAKPQATKPEVKKEEKSQPMKVANEGQPSKTPNQKKPATSRKRH